MKWPRKKDSIPKRYGKLSGWRVWGVRLNAANQPRLCGQYHVWWHGPKMTAEHTAQIRGSWGHNFGISTVAHKAPYASCSCGIYIQHLNDPVERWALQPIAARGLVQFWGQVMEHDKGWRAEHVEMVGPMTIDVRCLGSHGEKCANDATVIQREAIFLRPWCSTHSPVNEFGETKFGEPARFYSESVQAEFYPAREWVMSTAKKLQDHYGVEFWSWYDLEDL